MNDIFPAEPDISESPLAPHHSHLALIQSVSHELRSTFGVIAGLHSLLPIASGETEREDMYNRLHNNTEYATQLFSDLEDYCAIENGRMRVEPAPFRPAAAMEYVQKKAHPMLQRRNARVMLTGDSEMLVNCDEEKIRRILKNIVFYLTCVMRVQDIEIGWGARTMNWTLNAAYGGEALPRWLFNPENEPDYQKIGQHISLLLVRRLVLALSGNIYAVETGTERRQRILLQFPH